MAMHNISEATRELMEQASAAYGQHFDDRTSFERAIFVSWYCSVGDCTFCFMSTQRKVITDPKSAKRKPFSILAEIELCRLLDWKIEFISAGFSGVTQEELLNVLKYGSRLYGEGLWLNTGFMQEKALASYAPYLTGVSGSIETVNPALHKEVCPSKPIPPYLKLWEATEKLGLRKAMTIIIGIGESEEDIPLTIDFIREHGIDRITLYALRPVQGTAFREAPTLEYYLRWISRLRIAFPDKEILAGIWHNDLSTLPLLFAAGANRVTKYPGLKRFGHDWHHYVTNRSLHGRFAEPLVQTPELLGRVKKDLSVLDTERWREETFRHVLMYLRLMERSAARVHQQEKVPVRT